MRIWFPSTPGTEGALFRSQLGVGIAIRIAPPAALVTDYTDYIRRYLTDPTMITEPAKLEPPIQDIISDPDPGLTLYIRRYLNG